MRHHDATGLGMPVPEGHQLGTLPRSVPVLRTDPEPLRKF